VALNPLRARSFVRNHDALVPDGASIRVYVDGGETALPAIFRILDQGGVTLEMISLSRPSLDDVFLHQTGRSLREEAA
jgi:ABC-2 type transport system ATP-binding protein